MKKIHFFIVLTGLIIEPQVSGMFPDPTDTLPFKAIIHCVQRKLQQETNENIELSKTCLSEPCCDSPQQISLTTPPSEHVSLNNDITPSLEELSLQHNRYDYTPTVPTNLVPPFHLTEKISRREQQKAEELKELKKIYHQLQKARSVIQNNKEFIKGCIRCQTMQGARDFEPSSH